MTYSEKSLQDVLDTASGSKTSLKKIFGYLSLVVLGLILTLLLWPDNNDSQYSYQTEKISTGSLIVTVSATGKLRPTNQVEVGSELSGIMKSVYVNENDSVKAGQVLAQLDTSKLRDTVEKSRSALMGREAAVTQVRATLSEVNTNLYRLRQLHKISNGKIPSQNKIDAAVANVRRTQADEASALASVDQAKADLRSDETNLSKATLISPINGVVLKRSIEPGQTVAASFQAPVLFTIAEDLSKMKLHVDVDEADVGNIKNGQKSYFTVDAWPDREYSANIHRISFAAEVKDDVVTYPTILDVDNSDLSLRPGMTGTAVITTLDLTNQLLVPNAAFRVELATRAENKKPNKSVFGFLFPRPQRPKQKVRTEQQTGLSKLWLLTEAGPTELSVDVLATNPRFSAVKAVNLKPGANVIIDAIEKTP